TRATRAVSTRRKAMALLAAPALLMLAPRTVWAQTPVWREYRRDDLGYTVEMPGDPKVDVTADEDRDIRIRVIDASIDIEDMLLGVVFTEFRDALPPDDSFRLFRDGMQMAGMAITREVPHTMNGFPACDFIRETDTINFIRRDVLIGKLSIA